MSTTNRILDAGTTWDFLDLSGWPAPVADEIEEITRPGFDGHAFRKIGKRGTVFSMTGSRDVTDAEAITWSEGLRALQGKVVSVYDGLGNQYDNVVVRRATLSSQQRIRAAIGGFNASSTILLTCQFEMQVSQ